MVDQTPVVAMSSDHAEIATRLARHLGTSKLRRKIFNEIYGRARRPRSLKEIMAALKIQNRGANEQQVRNELDHLQKHHLISRIENDGSVTDGGKFLYRKLDNVRSIKDEIIKYADDKRAGERVPTKQRPLVKVVVRGGGRSKQGRPSTTKRDPLAVLYLTASTDLNMPLRVDAEMRQVQEAVRASTLRERIKLEYRPAADIDSLIAGLNDHSPKIVHFSGHGNSTGLATDKGKVGRPSAGYLSFSLLARALGATDSPPDVVVLNACNSAGAATVLNSTKVVIAMSKSVSDIAATVFAVKFYAAIASGQSIKSAFAQGVVAIENASIGEVDTPKLLVAPGVNVAKMVLV